MSGPKMRLQFPQYPDLVESKGGYLPHDNRAFALWYYYTLAQQLHERLGNSTDDQFGLTDVDPWMDPQYERIARSIALIYQFKDPDEFMTAGLWEVVTKQAALMGYPDPTGKNYTRPLRLILAH